MIRPILMAGVALPCLLLATTASAQDAASPTSDIVVTATRSARALADVPASVSIVTSDQIEGTPARTIDDVLRRVPSVDLPIASTNEQHPTDTIVSMRGLSGIRSLVLLDGVPLNDPFFGYVQWSEVPVETIDRVEVVRGGGAPLWGNYAMGGVINILTKPIDKTELVAEAAGGSRGAYRADGHAACAGDGYGLGLDAGVNHSDGYVEQIESARGAITTACSSSVKPMTKSYNVLMHSTASGTPIPAEAKTRGRLMTDAPTAYTGSHRTDRATLTFLVLLCLFSAAADALVIHLGKEPAMLSRFAMWCPGAAAVATCALHRIPQATLGWRWPRTRWLILAYTVPILYALPVYAAAWAVIGGALAPAPFATATASAYGFTDHPALATALIGVPLILTVGILATVTWALGEELGWRGFLLPRLVERIGFTGACLVSGLIWAVWHYPSLLWADYNAGTNPAYATACFSAMIVALGFMLSWLRLRSGSVWPCALLHASHNTFFQGIFDPLTADAGGSRLVTTEFGCGQAVTVALVAVVVIRGFWTACDVAASAGAPTVASYD